MGQDPSRGRGGQGQCGVAKDMRIRGRCTDCLRSLRMDFHRSTPMLPWYSRLWSPRRSGNRIGRRRRSRLSSSLPYQSVVPGFCSRLNGCIRCISELHLCLIPATVNELKPREVYFACDLDHGFDCFSGMASTKTRANPARRRTSSR